MSRRVQGEARVRASKQPPPTVMDKTLEELRLVTRKYLEMKANGAPDEHRHMLRGMIRGLSTVYAMWYGSTPTMPKKEFIKELEQRIAKEERANLEAK